MSRALDRGQQPIAPGALGTGTPGSGNFLRGDSTWESIPTPTIASTAEAEAGTNNTNFITPLRMREGFNASGSAPVYACRAWVNFNGVSGATIRASGNVSSVARNGTGDYTVNFTTAMPDADYAMTGSGENSTGPSSTMLSVISRTTSAVRIRCVNDGNNLRDGAEQHVVITR
jgi:hypothetical protein